MSYYGGLKEHPPPDLRQVYTPKIFQVMSSSAIFTPFGDPKGVKTAFWPPSGRLDGVYTWRKLKIVFFGHFERF